MIIFVDLFEVFLVDELDYSYWLFLVLVVLMPIDGAYHETVYIPYRSEIVDV